MDKLSKDNDHYIDATWLTEEPFLDIVPEDPLKKLKSCIASAKNRQACIRKVTILATG